jgi:endonuclease YncB( thermonuclease family)
MERFDLSGRNLEGANLSGAHLDGASLVRANLSGADLSDAHLRGANIEAADLSGADLAGADLEDVAASRTDLHEARIMEADLSDASLSGANMRGACLTGSSLSGASLPGVHLERAALTGADLDETKFWFDLRRAFLGAVGLAGAEHSRDASWPPGFDERAEELIEPREIPPRPLVKAPIGGTEVGRVVSVFDGDTVLVSTWKGRMKMRPIGIDAPTWGEEGADTAREVLRELLPHNQWIRFSLDRRRTDNFGRELVYLFGPDGTLVNQAMLRRGAAISQIDPPDRKGSLRNVRYARQLAAAEAWARQHARGLWEACPP